MFKCAIFIFTFVAVASAQRSFIRKCPLRPGVEACFVESANIALQELYSGHEELQIPIIKELDLGDLFFSLGDDLSFLLEDAKSFPKGIQLQNAQLLFGENNQWKGVELKFSVSDITWQVKYRAIGFSGNKKINEKGFAQINIGQYNGTVNIEFKRIEADGVFYLKARKPTGLITYEKFEFLPRDVIPRGEPLRPEHFQQLETPAIEKAREITLDLIGFTFNQILQEIPENEIFE